MTKAGQTAGISGDGESDRCGNKDWFSFLVVVWGVLLVWGFWVDFFFFNYKIKNIKGVTNTITYPPFLCS